MAKCKVVAIGVLGTLVVVAVCIGLVAGLKNKKSSSSSNDDDAAVLSTTTKPVAAICSQADFKKACVESLKSVADNKTASPNDYVKAALGSAVKEVRIALEKTREVGKIADNPLNQMAVEDCRELLKYAVDELQAAFSMVGDSELHTIGDREAELRNWLSAVISYQETCLDGFSQEELKKAMSDGLSDASKLTDNALSIVSSIPKILAAFNIIPSGTGGTSRRLLGKKKASAYYPEWFSAADRKLLQTQNSQLKRKPNAVVAQDGSGQYKTISAALAAYPKNLYGRYIVYVKAGIYDEYITVTKDQKNIFMYGDGPRKTIVTGRKSFSEAVTTYKTASFSTMGDGFIGKSMGFQNTAGPQGHQAVALRVQADMAAFYNCRMDAYQDTLYTQTHRQFYRNCVISGTVDFIFGDGSVVIQNSLIIVRKPMDGQQNTVTAQGRTKPNESTGIVIQNCRIVPEQKLESARFQIKTFLGRPWKQYARTVVMESTLGDFIQPAGWLPWKGNFALDTLYYAEYANRGPGNGTNHRVTWKGYRSDIDANEAFQFTAGRFIQGAQWLGNSGAPHFLGFRPAPASKH